MTTDFTDIPVSPGRQEIDGVLHVLRAAGPDYRRKRNRRTPRPPLLYYVVVPRESGGHRFHVRFKNVRGVDASCEGHPVRLRLTVKEPYRNGLGADAIRAVGECLVPEEHAFDALRSM